MASWNATWSISTVGWSSHTSWLMSIVNYWWSRGERNKSFCGFFHPAVRLNQRDSDQYPEARLGPSSVAPSPTPAPIEAGWRDKLHKGSWEQKGNVGYWVCCCPAPRVRRWRMRWRSCRCSPCRVCHRSTNAKMVSMCCGTSQSWPARTYGSLNRPAYVKDHKGLISWPLTFSHLWSFWLFLCSFSILLLLFIAQC